MKINELKKIAKENDYELEKMHGYAEVVFTRRVSIDGFMSNAITISLDRKAKVFIENFHCDDKDFNMIKAAVAFAETPPEDREEEKKFYLKHRWLSANKFVKHHTSVYEKSYELTSWEYGDKSDIQYTLKEIEEIKKKFNTDLKDFELVEVEE